MHLADEDAVLRNVEAISEGGPSKLVVSDLCTGMVVSCMWLKPEFV